MTLTPEEKHIVRKAISDNLDNAEKQLAVADSSGAQIFYQTVKWNCESILEKLNQDEQ